MTLNNDGLGWGPNENSFAYKLNVYFVPQSAHCMLIFDRNLKVQVNIAEWNIYNNSWT